MSVKHSILNLPRMVRVSCAGVALIKDGNQSVKPLHSFTDRLTTLHGLPEKLLQFLQLAKPSDPFSQDGVKSKSIPTVSLANLRKLFGLHFNPERVSQLSWPDSECLSASIGQVYSAVLDNKKIAIKVQHPKIRQHISADLDLLGLVSLPLRSKVGANRIADYRQELRLSLEREVSYVQELKNMKQFQNLNFFDPFFLIPNPIEEFCNDQILSMQWLEGINLKDSSTLSSDERRFAFAAMLRLFLFGIVALGKFHADPNPENFLLVHNPGQPLKLGVLDFGCCKELDLKQQTAILDLLFYPNSSSARPWLPIFQDLGFDTVLLRPFANKLGLIVEEILKPFRSDQLFSVETWHMSENLCQMLAEHRMAFRLAGPCGLIHFIRVFNGLISYARKYQIEINWFAELERVRKSLPSSKTNSPLSSQRCAGPELEPINSSARSSALYVRVEENGRVKAELRFKYELVNNLKELIPEEILASLESRKISLERIVSDAQNNNYAPGDLFVLQEGNKNCRVWLE